MKPRTTQIRRPDRNGGRAVAPKAAGSPEELDRELAEARVALHAARRQVQVEVERRQKIEGELRNHAAQDRERLRKKLHDGLGQVLTSISFLASSLRTRLLAQGFTDTSELDDIMALIQDAIVESRSIAAACDAPTRTAVTL